MTRESRECDECGETGVCRRAKDGWWYCNECWREGEDGYGNLGEDLVAVKDEITELKDELTRLRDLLSKSVRVQKNVEFENGEIGCRFIVGENHVVAEWRGDGISSDHVFVEDTALKYCVTTTPHDRCIRMVLEMVHWEVASAMLAGAGDGKLLPWCDRYDLSEDTWQPIRETGEE
jgi:hypothetical protein